MQKCRVVCPHCGKVNAVPVKDQYAKANCGECKQSLLVTKPANLDANAFDHLIVNSEIPVIVDFWAPWCGPCRMMAPAFEKAAESFALKVRFVKVNTEEQQALGGRFGIRSIPTVIAFKNGVEVDRVSGALGEAQLVSWAKRLI